jgi:DNA helicase INO80
MPPVGTVAPPAQAVPHEIPVPDEALVEAELVRIETLEMGDLDDLGFEVEKEEYLQRSRKRALDIEASEAEKRKVRR